MSDKITTTLSDGDIEIRIESDKSSLRIAGKDGSVSIPMRMLHLVAEHIETVIEKAEAP